MSITLDWLCINVRGEEYKSGPGATITCGWAGSRCFLHVEVLQKVVIDLQVELEVTKIAYSPQSNPSQAPIMIFTVMISRLCAWIPKQNNVWYGQIGIEFDPMGENWHYLKYKEFYRCLASCFSNPDDVQRNQLAIMKCLWANISATSALPINQAKFAVFKSLNLEHLKRLQPGEMLNDELVNAGIKQWLLVEHKQEDHAVHAVGTYLHGLISSTSKHVKPLLTADQLLENQHILVPIHMNNNHWILVIIAVPENWLESAEEPFVVTILNSLSTPNSHEKVGKSLCDWLTTICAEKSPTKPQVVLTQAKVLHQLNFLDSGVYLLHFVKVFLSDPDFFMQHFQNPQENADLNVIWCGDQISSLRQEFLSYIKNTELAAER